MAEPPIIGSGKPHTVSLPEGSIVATQRRQRNAGSPVPEEAPAPVRTGQAPDPLTQELSKVRLRPAKRSRPRPAATPAGQTGAAPARAGDAALLARIAELEKRNGQIRNRLDTLAATDGEPE